PKRATALPPGAWATIARRTARTDAYVIAAEREPAVHALPLLDAAVRSLPATEAARVLDAAAARPELASAAFQLRARVASGADGLVDVLHDASRGADAAAALARRGAGAVAVVGAKLLASTDRVEQRNALLYLRLVGTPEALDAARTYAARPGADAALRREIASW
ncbi:MAG TPA: hypothetical protein VFO79_02540, partial [Xanthomonadales bacterium]|nr:hypothetical protein [Xanthomonadales bacterium]